MKTNIEQIKIELRKRELLFHHPEYGRTREEIENYTAKEFWEVGASGKVYSRDFVVDSIALRYFDKNYNGIHSCQENEWIIQYCNCRKIAESNYLVTYTLIQGDRISSRLTIWRLENEIWKIPFHQGAIVEKA